MSSNYYHTPESVAEYIKMAEGHNGAALIQELKIHLPPPAKILEIGSGPGSDWQLLRSAYKVVGSDYSEEFIKHLQSKHPGEQFHHLNASSLEIDEQFDGIYSNKVLHHLTDEELANSIQKQHGLLHTGGVICHSFWKGEGSETFKGMFVNYHSESGLTKLIEPYFDLQCLQLYPEFEAEDSILLIARKK